MTKCINKLIDNDENNLDSYVIKLFRAIGAGSSPWIQLTLYLMRLEKC